MNLQDNDYSGKEIDCNSETKTDLQFFSDTSIEQLASKQEENLLIFPHCLNKDYKDIDCKDTIITFKGNKVCTSNYMGFIARNSTEISISSRFDKGNQNYFLHYMLQKVFAINIFNMKLSKSNQSVWDFLIYLFPFYLKKALRQGLYKKYQRNRYNDAKVKGTIDIARHIRINVPFVGKIAYSAREHCYDNNLTQLIRHTIEHIACMKLGGLALLRSDTDMCRAVDQIVLATPSYVKGNRTSIILKNLRPEKHPYYTEYSHLQKLCLMILRRDKISFGERDKDKIYGLVFDGAWLWEEYLNTVLQPLGYIHPQNKEQKDSITLFVKNGGVRYPDFYKKNIAVLDAKYKIPSENKHIERNDLNQIITYMHCLPTDNGALIYPNNNVLTESLITCGELRGKGGHVYKVLHSIKEYSENVDYRSFVQTMINEEQELVARLKSIESAEN